MNRSRASLTLLIAIWLAMSLLANPRGNFPLNDDWVYARAVDTIFSPQGFSLATGHSAANLIAQAYWGALFSWTLGPSFTALRISTLALGLVGVLAMYMLLCEAGASQRRATVGALALACNPLYFGLANTFMTDVPFLALAIAAVWLLMRGLQRDDRMAAAMGLVLAAASLLVRQVALAVFLGYAVALVMKRGVNRRAVGAALVTVVAGVALQWGYQSWLASSGRVSPLLNKQVGDLGQLVAEGGLLRAVRHSWRGVFDAALFAAAFAAPVILPTAAARLASAAVPQRRFWLTGGAVATAVTVVFLMRSHHYLPVGDPRSMPASGILEAFGLGPITVRDVYVLHQNVPTAGPLLSGAWQALTLVSVISLWCAVYLLTSFAGSVMSRDWRLTVRRLWPPAFPAAIAATYLAPVVVSIYFDRYFLPVLPFAMAATVACGAGRDRRAPRWVEGGSLLLIAVLGVFSTLATHDYLAWNRVRWETTNHLLRDRGLTPSEIDGGYEFNGSNLYRPDYVPVAGKSWWWVAGDEYMVANGPLPGYDLLERHSVNRWLPTGPSEVLVLRANGQPRHYGQ